MPPKLSTVAAPTPRRNPALRTTHGRCRTSRSPQGAARNTAGVVVRTTMSRVSCQSSRECCADSHKAATSGTFPKFPQGRSANFRWTPSIRRCFAKSTLVGICASLRFSPACAKDTGWCHGPASTLTRYRSWGGDGSMSGVAHLCVGQHGVCARTLSAAQSRGTAAPPSRQLASLPSPFRAPSGPTVTVGWTFARNF